MRSRRDPFGGDAASPLRRSEDGRDAPDGAGRTSERAAFSVPDGGDACACDAWERPGDGVHENPAATATPRTHRPSERTRGAKGSPGDVRLKNGDARRVEEKPTIDRSFRIMRAIW